MYSLVHEGTPRHATVLFRDMGVNDIAVIVQCFANEYRGHYVLRTRTGIVSLSDTNFVWPLEDLCGNRIGVCLLEPGEKVILEVK